MNDTESQLSTDTINQSHELTKELTLESLPTPNNATIDMLNQNDAMLNKLRDDQHYCDSMVIYWQTRHADVSRAIEGVMALTSALNRVAPRDTSVVTRRSKPANPVRKRAPKPETSNA